jgi:hypothetical protein
MDLNEKLAQRRKERENKAAAVHVNFTKETTFENVLDGQNDQVLINGISNPEETLSAIKERELQKSSVIVSNFQRAEDDAELNRRLEEMATERFYIEEKVFLALSVILVIVAFIDWWFLGFVAFSVFVIIFSAKLKKYKIQIIKEFELNNK